ncbi:ROK family protein [Paenibacillus sp. GCM10027626]|uniref:ROK family protein n=1 Tax=Paenibacillus sp. GCM10027626 TaxID=3273411 RepID=UPI00363443C0
MVNEVAIGVDIGGTKIHFAITDRDGNILNQHIVPTPVKEGSARIMEQVLLGIEKMVDAHAAGDSGQTVITGIGIGSAGQINFETGEVDHAVDTIPGWTGTKIRAQVEGKFPFPVYVDNDVNVVALAEKCYGAGLQYKHFLCVTLGTGVGGAIVNEGEIVRGAFGAAGEFGHITVNYAGPRCSCGNYGCIELYASGTGIARVAQEAIDSNGWKPAWPADSRAVLQAWQQGDEQAAIVMQEVIHALSAALASLIHAFNPQAVIIGGGVADSGEQFLSELRKQTGERTAPAMWRSTKLLPAVVGNHSGVIGAAAQVWLYSDGK